MTKIFNVNLSNVMLLRAQHLMNHILFIYVLSSFFSYKLFLVSVFIYAIYASFGISIGFHRLLSHKSFMCPIWFENICVVLGCLANGGSPISWVAAHRMHHAYADTEHEPHSVKHIGRFRTYIHFWNKIIFKRKIIRDLYKKPFVLWMSKNYFLFLFLYQFSIFIFFGLKIYCFVYSVPAVLAFHGYGLINSMGHSNKAEADTSVNSFFINIFTFGEGWHRNHHNNPNSYRIGFDVNQCDVCAWAIEKMGFKNRIN